MRSAVAGLGLAATLGSLACAGALLGCDSIDVIATDGGIKYMGDGPAYDFRPKDAGVEAVAPGPPVASLSSYFVDFGSTACGAATDQTVTFINNGDTPLNVSTMVSGTNFSVSPSSLTVAGGGLAGPHDSHRHGPRLGNGRRPAQGRAERHDERPEPVDDHDPAAGNAHRRDAGDEAGGWHVELPRVGGRREEPGVVLRHERRQRGGACSRWVRPPARCSRSRAYPREASA